MKGLFSGQENNLRWWYIVKLKRLCFSVFPPVRSSITFFALFQPHTSKLYFSDSADRIRRKSNMFFSSALVAIVALLPSALACNGYTGGVVRTPISCEVLHTNVNISCSQKLLAQRPTPRWSLSKLVRFLMELGTGQCCICLSWRAGSRSFIPRNTFQPCLIRLHVEL